MTNKIKSGSSIIVCGLIIWAAASCNTTKKTTESIPAAGSESHNLPRAADYIGQKLDYRSFSGKTDLQVRTETQNQNLNLNVRMRKDQDIWTSVLAMGVLEAVRAYITPDSLFGLDRLSKTAYVLSYKEGMQLIRAEIPFPMLQNLIIGNPLIQDVPIANVEVKDSTILITQNDGAFRQVLTYHLRSHVLQHLSLKSSTRDFRCEADYSEYKPLALKQPFAFSRDIQIEQDGKKIYLKLDFNKAQLDEPVDMNFVIPSSYSRGAIPQ
jgi:hypothetical protein